MPCFANRRVCSPCAAKFWVVWYKMFVNHIAHVQLSCCIPSSAALNTPLTHLMWSEFYIRYASSAAIIKANCPSWGVVHVRLVSGWRSNLSLLKGCHSSGIASLQICAQTWRSEWHSAAAEPAKGEKGTTLRTNYDYEFCTTDERQA